MASSETEKSEKVKVLFLGFTVDFGEKDSSFYDLPWGRGILVSVTCFCGK